MKHLKKLALAAVATGALMAFIGASTASATVLCSTTVESCPEAQRLPNGTLIDFSLSAGTSSAVRETSAPGGEGKVLNTCKSSTFKGELTNAGSSTETATGKFTEVTWGTCSLPTRTTLLGGFEIHRIASTSNGTVTADGETRTTINTVLFGSCSYTVQSGKSMGDLTEGNPAVLHINAVKTKTIGSAAVCPETLIWTATYMLTEPSSTTTSVSGG
jgi:hypothetical protein